MLSNHRPLRTSFIVIYATLGLLCLAMPQSLVDWAMEMKSGRTRDLLVKIAVRVQALSNRVGAELPFELTRRSFLELMRDEGGQPK
jgi:hypothetical protein